jgi:hypothetical protein
LNGCLLIVDVGCGCDGEHALDRELALLWVSVEVGSCSLGCTLIIATIST